MLPVQSLNIQAAGQVPATTITIEKINGLSIKMETPNLIVRTMQEEDILPMQALFQREENVTHYADGKPRDPEWTDRRCRGWMERWAEGNPFSGMAIYNKQDEFVGYFVLGYGDHPETGEENAPGFSEAALMIEYDHWNKGHCKEILKAAKETLIPSLKQFKLSGASLESIVFTTSPDNQYMVRACEALDLKPWKTLEPNEGSNRWNKQKYIYWIDV